MSICHSSSVITAARGRAFSPYDLALTTINAGDFEIAPTTATAGIKVKRAGTIQETILGVYTDQNPSTEWILAAQQTSTIGDLFECWLEKVIGTDPTTGPALEQWHTINSDRIWEWVATSQTLSFTGILYIREIATPSNLQSCTVFASSESS